MFGKKEKFWNVINDQDSFRVGFPGFKVSDRPIFSQGYANCNAVVLFRKPYAALSHYDTRLMPYPDENTRELLDRILSKPCSDSKISALLVGGDERHFEGNMEFLTKQKIPIIGQYLDRWNDYEVLSLFKRLKDVVVIPETQEVIVRKFPGIYKKLT
jgi:hypothetical protein